MFFVGVVVVRIVINRVGAMIVVTLAVRYRLMKSVGAPAVKTKMFSRCSTARTIYQAAVWQFRPWPRHIGCDTARGTVGSRTRIPGLSNTPYR